MARAIPDEDIGLEEWVAARNREEAALRLQAAGVAAAPMLRIAELPDFPYYRERGCFRSDAHPHLDEPVRSEARTAGTRAGNDHAIRPAPLIGEHSADIVRDWLGLDDSIAADLVAAGVLQPTPEAEYAAIRKHREMISASTG